MNIRKNPFEEDKLNNLTKTRENLLVRSESSNIDHLYLSLSISFGVFLASTIELVRSFLSRVSYSNPYFLAILVIFVFSLAMSIFYYKLINKNRDHLHKALETVEREIDRLRK